ncbi:beta galactosidase jelly roll domain-containing protein [Sphingomonas sp. BT-65]|uniref:sialate O-acetylesterase n=1 Tax=Sphingomonas sp. BT-65 TaxID=2989821 RepID=UPI0022363CF6|nr:sialate O-acetylesterase [Sphingomonas sp. BT-65]MCW4462013.1 beta galactosidase jelly roll domain-containing protein [Sphingomonas sp. BT-65]
MIVGARRGLVLAALIVPAAAAAQTAPPLLDPVFADHMVLQRGRPIALRGQAPAGGTVTAVFAGEEKHVRAGNDGKWRAEFAARDAATGLTLEVRGPGASVRATDVSVGDVFLCSGQSNMVVPVNRALNPQREFARPVDRNIRFLRLDQTAAAAPQASIQSRMGWTVPSAATVKDFSAVCMFFGREVAAAKKVPVGLVHSAWGGSQIEAWIPAAGLRPMKNFDPTLDLLAAYARNPAAGFALVGKEWENWWRSSVSASDLPWTRTPAAVAALKPAPAAPGDWKGFDDPELRQHTGMVWFYRTLELNPEQAAKARRIDLGEVGEIGSVWLNGRFLGSSGGGEASRYDVPAGMLKPGTNIIAVSGYSSNRNVDAGLLGPASAMALTIEGGASVPLASGWRYARVADRRAVPPRVPWEGRMGITAIYNAMVAPLGPLPLAGVVWYQGESNATRADEYKPLLQAMIASWRAQFRPDLPFVIVQLANFGELSAAAGEDGWARVREAQREIAETDPHTALAVTIDVGEKYDIHPPNKAVVAARAFQAARAAVYGEKLAPSGPRPVAAKLAGGQITVSFRDVSGALMAASANRPFPFMVCASKTQCSYADARLDGNSVVVDVPAGVEPAWVRYCWGQSPICNLFDTAQAPAGPFELKVAR